MEVITNAEVIPNARIKQIPSLRLTCDLVLTSLTPQTSPAAGVTGVGSDWVDAGARDSGASTGTNCGVIQGHK